MLVSHSLRCLFINIPKCASISTKRMFKLSLVTDPLWHCPWEQAQEILGNEVTDNYFKFTLVRNPWERVVSAWKMFEQHKFRKQSRSYSLSEFLDVVTDSSIGYEANYRTLKERPSWEQSIENIRHHTLPAMHSYYGLVNRKNEIITDYVGQFEHLQNDLAIVADKLGVRFDKVPHTNRTRHGSYTEYYDDSCRETVSRYFKSDIDAFGYQFDSGPTKQWQSPIIVPAGQL